MSKLKNSHWQKHPTGSVEQIIAHGEFRASRGLPPSMKIGRESPKKLLELAKAIQLRVFLQVISKQSRRDSSF